VFTHKWKAQLVACDLNIIFKGEGLLRITDIHIHWKSDNILETMLDREETTGH